MNDWLDVLLEEIARKQREASEAEKEQKRRKQDAEEKDVDQGFPRPIDRPRSK